MTIIEELDQKHLEIAQTMIEAEVTLDLEMSAHSKVSIEYAISVLEETAKSFGYEVQPWAWHKVHEKIQGLRALLE